MESKQSNPNDATFINPTSVRVSKDGRYLIIALQTYATLIFNSKKS